MPNLQLADPIDEVLDAPTVAAFKALLALDALDNTSDASKPVSAAQQTALNTKQAAGTYVTPATLSNSTLPVAATTLSATGAVAVTTNSGNFTAAQNSFAVSGTTFNAVLYSGGAYAWTDSSAATTGTADLFLRRDAANTLAQRNLTEAQAFRVYGTWATAGVDYSVVNLRGNAYGGGSNVFALTAYSGGTGGNSATLYIGSDDTAGILTLRAGAASRWTVNASGHFLAATDNTYDIGASGATRPREIFTGSSIRSGKSVLIGYADSTGVLGHNLYGYITFNSAGVWMFSDAPATDFNRLQLGGTTSSFPSLKRSSAQIHCRLADDSADAAFQALQVNVAGTKVLGEQGETVADVAVGSVPQTGAGATDCMDAINLILARLRDHGIIAT